MPLATPLKAVEVEIKTVLLATDFSAASSNALRYACWIARAYGAEFYFMHVISSVGFAMAGPEAQLRASDLAFKDARDYLLELSGSGTLRGVHPEIIVRRGEVWEELVDVATQYKADIVVVGTHGRRGLGKVLLGSVAEQVFRNACCMVLTVGARVGAPPQKSEPRPLLFATDFGESSLKALLYAISLANHHEAPLILAHVIRDFPLREGGYWYTPADVIRLRAEAQNAAVARMRELLGDVELVRKPEFVVEFGDPVEGILKAAGNVDGIIMGLNAASYASSHTPWSTAYDVVCRASCPVLTVRK